MVRHVLLLKVKAGIPEEQTAAALQGLEALVGVVPGLKAVEGGRNLGAEERARGYTHGMVLTFEDLSAVQAYATHPAHVQAAVHVRACAEEMLVIDL